MLFVFICYLPTIVLLIAFVITVAISREGILGNTALYNNKLFNYLGAISLPMFLIQNLFRSLAGSPFGFLPKSGRMLFICFGTILGAIVLRLVIEKLRPSNN